MDPSPLFEEDAAMVEKEEEVWASAWQRNDREWQCTYYISRPAVDDDDDDDDDDHDDDDDGDGDGDGDDDDDDGDGDGGGGIIRILPCMVAICFLFGDQWCSLIQLSTPGYKDMSITTIIKSNKEMHGIVQSKMLLMAEPFTADNELHMCFMGNVTVCLLNSLQNSTKPTRSLKWIT